MILVKESLLKTLIIYLLFNIAHASVLVIAVANPYQPRSVALCASALFFVAAVAFLYRFVLSRPVNWQNPYDWA